MAFEVKKNRITNKFVNYLQTTEHIVSLASGFVLFGNWSVFIIAYVWGLSLCPSFLFGLCFLSIFSGFSLGS